MKKVSVKQGPWTDLHHETEDYYIFFCGFPVVEGHMLYVPKSKSAYILGLCFEAAYKAGQSLVMSGEADGYNIGMNNHEAAGQTIDWPHIHLIPRRTGDVEDPVGGVRNVIPSQGNYRSDNYVRPKG